MPRRHLAVPLVLASIVVVAPDAGARRSATAAESRAMWRVVDADNSCQHRRGKVSTVRSAKWRYGIVTIADSHCGNGSFVMRRPKSGGRWRQRVAGSDIGAPQRCAADVKRVPLRVLRDLLAFEVCP